MVRQNRGVLLADLSRTSGSVAATSARLGKLELLADCLRGAPITEVEIGRAHV